MIGWLLISPVYAASSVNDPYIQRGAAVTEIVRKLSLKLKNINFLNKCSENYEECFFSFLARSNYREISIEPLILYPDVRPGSVFYETINVATALDITIGYQDLPNGPFKPWRAITRAEALKIMLAGVEKMKWEDGLGEASAKNDFSGLWWKLKYLKLAFELGVIDLEKAQKPDEFLRKSEFDKMLEKVKSLAE